MYAGTGQNCSDEAKRISSETPQAQSWPAVRMAAGIANPGSSNDSGLTFANDLLKFPLEALDAHAISR